MVGLTLARLRYLVRSRAARSILSIAAFAALKVGL